MNAYPKTASAAIVRRSRETDTGLLECERKDRSDAIQSTPIRSDPSRLREQHANLSSAPADVQPVGKRLVDMLIEILDRMRFGGIKDLPHRIE